MNTKVLIGAVVATMIATPASAQWYNMSYTDDRCYPSGTEQARTAGAHDPDTFYKTALDAGYDVKVNKVGVGYHFIVPMKNSEGLPNEINYFFVPGLDKCLQYLKVWTDLEKKKSKPKAKG